MAGRRSDALLRLIASVEAFRAARPYCRVQLHLLLQRADADAAAALPDWIDARAIPDRVSLSRARNLLLDRVAAATLDTEALVAFPDDDAWYPAGLLENVVSLFGRDPA
ncbi:hypothetical protein J8J40_24785, partial [Mycobacterium tuberculosis]|nr:hypothetical protein [Mycobacterium tuberculosis]